MRLYTFFYSLQTSLHVSGDTFTHHQEHIKLQLQHLALIFLIYCLHVLLMMGEGITRNM